MALDNTGFHRPTFEEILTNKINRAKELFGNDIDTSELTPLGKFIRISAYDMEEVWETAEGVYYARFPNTAQGVSLDRLLPFAGITRKTATQAHHKVKITGQADFAIPNGSIFGTVDGMTFYLVNDVVLNSDGVGEGTVACTVAGTVGNVPLGSINELVNPIAGVETVQHTDILSLGENEETDIALRVRFQKAISGAGFSTLESLIGAILRINGVKSCYIAENDTSNEDSFGRPPHSFECYVYAGDELNTQIAETIFQKKPIGITAHGETTVQLTTLDGRTQDVKFTKVKEVPIHIKVTIKKNEDFELTGAEDVKTAVMGYILSLASGNDVIINSLYGKIFSVPGVKDVSYLALSTDGELYKSENVTINNAQVAITSADKITVEVTEYVDTTSI